MNIATFRLMEERDIFQRVQALNSRSVLDGVFIEYPVSESKTAEWFKNINKSNSRRDFVYDTGDRVIGFSGLVNINRINATAEAYIFMVDEFQGSGYGNKLFNMTLDYAKIEANLRKILLYVSEDNIRAVKFYQRGGFSLEGTLKRHVWHRGRYQDRYIYSKFLDDAKVADSKLYPITPKLA